MRGIWNLLAGSRAPTLPAEPERPVAFGYRNQWLALAARHRDAVVEAVGRITGLRRARPCSWGFGIPAAHGRVNPRGVFVTPALGEWTLAVGVPRTPRPGQVLVDVSRELHTTALLFGSHCVSDYMIWGRANRGRLLRLFQAEHGETWHNAGLPGPAELQLDLRFFEDLETAPDDAAADEIAAHLPDDDTVTALAGLLSIDPTQLGKAPWDQPGVGTLLT